MRQNCSKSQNQKNEPIIPIVESEKEEIAVVIMQLCYYESAILQRNMQLTDSENNSMIP